jgi:hypothetical protein
MALERSFSVEHTMMARKSHHIKGRGGHRVPTGLRPVQNYGFMFLLEDVP